MRLPGAPLARWLLVLVISAGVIAMHALMDVGGGCCASATSPGHGAVAPHAEGMSSSGRTSHTPVPPSAMVPANAPVPLNAVVPLNAGTMASGAVPAAAARGVAATAGSAVYASGSAVHTATSTGSGHSSCGTMLGHLCLAVLDGLGLLLMIVLLLIAGSRVTSDAASSGRTDDGRRPRGPPPARPPNLPSLAELCVLRR